ncbi:LysR family transcriptional regulator substrate-binding protein [Turicimonas muris]|uniref:LysR family transcriptional regulator substrate-binding protein n=1 Tax=Turicimonas muris TaxID=1796652 RepID=UPI0020CBA26B|nr:LysR family transcriptional regulator substrate-binding protein [Turicimonas muris]
MSARAKRELSQQGELGGTIVLGVVESSVMEYLSRKIKKFREKYSRIKFHIHSATGEELRKKIDADKLDLAVLIEPVEVAKYKSVPLDIKERWGVVVREDSVEQERLAFSKKEAASLELILPSRDIVIEEICEWLGVSEKDLKIVALHNLLSNATAMVQNGLGSSLCIEGSFTNRGCPGLRFVPIEPEMTSGHVLIRKRNKSLPKIAEHFWEFLEEEIRKDHEVEA